MVLKRIAMGLLLLLFTVHLTGCDFIQSLPIPFLHKDEDAVEDEEAVEEEEPAAEQEALIDTKPQPVIDNYRPIAVKMPDGLKIEATLYIPGYSPYKAPIVSEESEDASGGGGAPEAAEGAAVKKEDREAEPAKIQYPLIILFHGLSGDRWEWGEYPRHLVNAGYAVLALDLRGHGDSVYQGKHLKVWRQFDRSDWDKMAMDTQHVLKYIAKQSKFNSVNTHKVGVVGVSIGANVALTFAHLDAKDVKAAVLLSPGLEYQGIRTEEIMKHFRTPVYLLASTEDAYAADSTEQLYNEALGKKKIKIFQDLGHGIDMLNNDPELGRDILDWLKQQVSPTGAAVATEAPAESDVTEEPAETPKAKPEPAEPKKPEPKKSVTPVKATKSAATTSTPASSAKPKTTVTPTVKAEKSKATTLPPVKAEKAKAAVPAIPVTAKPVIKPAAVAKPAATAAQPIPEPAKKPVAQAKPAAPVAKPVEQKPVIPTPPPAAPAPVPTAAPLPGQ